MTLSPFRPLTTLVLGDDAAIGGERLRLSDVVDGLHAEHVLLPVDQTHHVCAQVRALADLEGKQRQPSARERDVSSLTSTRVCQSDTLHRRGALRYSLDTGIKAAALPHNIAAIGTSIVYFLASHKRVFHEICGRHITVCLFSWTNICHPSIPWLAVQILGTLSPAAIRRSYLLLSTDLSPGAA